MSEERRPFQPVHAGVGTSSIILVFVVLCLTAFGVLALISARSSEQIMLKNTQAVCDYYQAAADANEYMAGCLEDGIACSYERNIIISDTLRFDLAFDVTEDGRVVVTRFRTQDAQEDSEEFADFE